MTDLIPLESVNAMELFTEGGLDDLLARIEFEAFIPEPDLTTAAGRKEIASVAHKVAKSKVVIDNAGKTLVAGWKEKAKEVDGHRRTARVFLDELKDQVRKPLNEWEAEKERLEAEEAARMAKEVAHVEALEAHELWKREQQVLADQADLRKKRIAYLAEQKEAERVEKLKKEAEARANEKAEDMLKREREEAARKVAKAEFEVKRQRMLQEEQDKREKKMREEAEAVAKALRENAAHQLKVNKGAFDELVRRGLAEALARDVITLIAQAKIPGVRMVYE